MPHSLVLRQSVHKTLQAHLYPGDGLETAAIMLCHLGKGKSGFRLMANSLILIPSEVCPDRTSHSLSWPFADYMQPDKITEIDLKGLSIITIHNHPEGMDRFSAIDNRNDKQLFGSVCNWFDDGRPNGSAIMMPNGKIVSRLVDARGKFTIIESNSIVGKTFIFGNKAKLIKRYRTTASGFHRLLAKAPLTCFGECVLV